MSVERKEYDQPYDIYIKDTAHVEAIKERWREIIPDQFHVLADFDRTLTQGTIDGAAAPSVIAQIRDGGYLSEAYTAEAHRLFDQYHPIEIDESIPMDERIAAMHAWWQKHFTLLIESGLNRSVIERIARERPLVFRDGTETLIQTLKEHTIPLVILSAAPGDMIDAYLAEHRISHEGIHVIATRYDFDEAGQATRVREPIIHSLNKREITVEGHDAYADIANRGHVLLLGDGIGDIGMVDGFPYESLLKVGFLNQNVSERKEAFMDAYDIVIAHDGPMTPVNQLLSETLFQ
jgi:5'-nucleotidase